MAQRNILYYLGLLHEKISNITLPDLSEIPTHINDMKTDITDCKTILDDISTQQVTDSSILTDMRTLLFDSRYLSSSYLSKFRTVYAYTGSYLGWGTGATGIFTGSSGQINAGGYPNFNQRLSRDNGSNLDLCFFIGEDNATCTMGLPWDNCKITCDSANDTSAAGINARQILLKYYDNNNTLQTVTHDLANTGTLYNIREIVQMEVVTWGTYGYNDSFIYVQNNVTNHYVNWITNKFNIQQPWHIVIPVNGYVYLKSLNVQATTGRLLIRIYLVKQTTSTMVSAKYSVLFQTYTAATDCLRLDLSEFPRISGPTSTSENWAICAMTIGITGTGIENAVHLVARVYRP